MSRSEHPSYVDRYTVKLILVRNTTEKNHWGGTLAYTGANSQGRYIKRMMFAVQGGPTREDIVEFATACVIRHRHELRYERSYFIEIEEPWPYNDTRLVNSLRDN